MHRFYCPSFDQGYLSEEESRHASSVLRLKEGESCSLFDGKGKEAKAQITLVEKKRVEFTVITAQQTVSAPFRLHLGQAIAKNKAMDLIVQKTTELGVSVLHPILSDRSVVQIEGEKSNAKQEKWKQQVIEACKQCGQNHLPEVKVPLGVQDFLNEQRGFKGLKLIASLQPDAKPLRHTLNEVRGEKALDEVMVLVGPEGDFTPAEMGVIRSEGFLPVSLGSNVLRTETAALYLTSVLLYEMQ